MTDSDRKYRQRGYQDEPRPQGPRPRPKPEPYDPRIPRDPKTPNMMGFTEVFRCTRCGHVESASIGSLSTCGKCKVDLRACIQCQFFDSSARFECMQTIPARVSPKDARNDCALYAPRMRVERETHSAAPASARQAFDDLFK